MKKVAKLFGFNFWELNVIQRIVFYLLLNGTEIDHMTRRYIYLIELNK